MDMSVISNFLRRHEALACFTRISTRVVPAYYLLAAKEEETVNHGVVNLPLRYKNHQVSLFLFARLKNNEVVEFT